MKRSPKLTRAQLPFLPIGNQLMLKGIEISEKTAGGIILPDKMRHPVNQGIIVAKGETVPDQNYNDAFALGNVVVYPLYSDSSIDVEEPDPKHAGRHISVRYTIVPFEQVICSDFGYFANLQNEK